MLKDKDETLTFKLCESLYDNYKIIDDLYNRIKNKYWGQCITE